MALQAATKKPMALAKLGVDKLKRPRGIFFYDGA
jgi:hypothetical protein